MEIAGLDHTAAWHHLEAANWDVKVAAVSALLSLDPATARAHLATADGSLRGALATVRGEEP
jgi:N-acetylmuramic acid 6-phosphate (MurNAc-6-P) etherase